MNPFISSKYPDQEEYLKVKREAHSWVWGFIHGRNKTTLQYVGAMYAIEFAEDFNKHTPWPYTVSVHCTPMSGRMEYLEIKKNPVFLSSKL